MNYDTVCCVRDLRRASLHARCRGPMDDTGNDDVTFSHGPVHMLVNILKRLGHNKLHYGHVYSV